MRLQQWAANGWLRPHKTNTAEYDAAGTVSPSEAAELRAFAGELRSDVIAWLEANHPSLITSA